MAKFRGAFGKAAPDFRPTRRHPAGRPGNRVLALALEQRYLFDGAGAVAAANAMHDASPYADPPPGNDPMAAALANHVLPPPPDAPQEVRAADPAQDSGKREVVFIESNLSDLSTLINGIRAGVGVEILDAGQDGLTQIAQWAEGHSGYDAIHLISHGAEATLALGTTTLDQSGLATRAADLGTIGQALAPGGDLLLYGCAVAQGTDGLSFLAGLASATGADVAASTDVTGAADLGGNWTLEARIGAVEATALSVDAYPDLLPSLFGSQVTYGTGTNPTSVAVGDLNGDGKLDLVIANVNGANISVLLGHGDGTFASQVTYATGAGPQSVAIGDLNGDGKLDIAVASTGQFNNSVSVLLGNGDGTFGARSVIATSLSQPDSIAVGDLNGDGKLDLVVANSGAGAVVVLLGHGDGTFGATVSYAIGTNVPWVAIGDLNGDGKPDLVTVNTGSNTVSVLLGIGDGTFASQVAYAVGASPNSVAIGDLNGDGKLDIAVTNSGDFFNPGVTVSVLLGNGDGTFASQVTYAVGTSPNSVAIADLNGDGKLDLAVANNGSNTVSVLLGHGDGTFASQVTYATGSTPGSVAVGDFDGNGRLDLVTANRGANTVSVLLNTGATPAIAIGAIATDNIINASEHGGGITISGTTTDVEDGRMVTVTIKNGGATVHTYANAATVGGGAWHYDVSSADIAALANGVTYTVTADVSNAGNVAATEATRDVAVDTVAPTLTITSNVAAVKAGETATITFTFSEAPTGFAAGDVVTSNGTLSNFAVTGDPKVYTATFTPTPALASGNAGITVASGTYTDAAGNTGGAGTTPSVSIDTLAPNKPATPSLDAGSDSGSSNGDQTTSANSLVFNGTAETGATVELYKGGVATGATATATGGAYSISYNGAALGDGAYTFTVRATDAAGNASIASDGLAVTIDRTPPSSPSKPSLAPSSDSGPSSSDGITSATTPTFSGTAEAGSTVKLYDGPALVATTNADGGGHWSVATLALGAGGHTITAKATDAAGNASGASSGQDMIIETAAPTSVGGTLVVPNQSGTGAEVGTVSASDPGGQALRYELTDTAGGRFVIDPNTGKVTLNRTLGYDFSSTGQYPITVRVTNAAGLTRSETITIKVTLSPAPPPPPPPAPTVSASAAISTGMAPTGTTAATISVGTVGATDTGAGNSGGRQITMGAMNGGSADSNAGNSGGRLITISNMNSSASGSMISNASSTGTSGTGRGSGGTGATFSENLGGGSSFGGSGVGFGGGMFSGLSNSGGFFSASGFAGNPSGGIASGSSTTGGATTGGDPSGRSGQGQDNGQQGGLNGKQPGERGQPGPEQGQPQQLGEPGGSASPVQPDPQPHAWLFGPAAGSFSEQLADASGKFERDRLDLLRMVRVVASLTDRVAA